MVLNCYWVMVTETVWFALHITCISLFFNVIFTLFVLTLFNGLFRKVAPKLALQPGELIVIYVMLSVATAIAGQDFMQLLPATVVHPFWFASPENEWESLFWRYIPSWLSVQDKKVLRQYFEGEASFYQSQNFLAWLSPIAAWFIFTLALVSVMLCLNILLRKKWTETEKLAFPIIQLPFSMSYRSRSFFRNPILWSGFALAGSIDLVNGLHFLYPGIPYIPIKLQDISYLFSQKPWSAIGWTPISAYPFIIGLAFFVPLDLSFSCWFFYVLIKIERILGSIAGLSTARFPYVGEQSSGAWLALCLLILWLVLWEGTKGKMARGQGGKRARRQEGKGFAILGILAGTAVLVGFCLKTGMSLWVIVAFFLIYFALSIAITRVRAELGPSSHEMYFTNPQRILVWTFGSRRLGTANLTMISLMYWFNRCNRSNPMPHQLEGFKLAQLANISSSRLIFAMLLSAVVGILAAFWAQLHILFSRGAAAGTYGFQLGMGWETFTRLQNWLSTPTAPDIGAISAMSVGAIFTWGLFWLRRLFLWSPFHPVGYVLATSFPAIDYIWSSMFLSWLIKWFLLSHGGLAWYRKSVPFFLGLILGEYIVGSLWSLIGVIGNMQIYRIWIW
ncbi:hypothetical protein FJZ31_07240 [Candidatus Poribacteria bacterium]|nr:hypothetical protein [Candidatus Poribacteria bacterium]